MFAAVLILAAGADPQYSVTNKLPPQPFTVVSRLPAASDLPTAPAPAGFEWVRLPNEPWKLRPLAGGQPVPFAPAPAYQPAPGFSGTPAMPARPAPTTATPTPTYSAAPAPFRGLTNIPARNAAPFGSTRFGGGSYGFIPGCATGR